jgi:PASTA domain
MSDFVEECRREWKRLRVPDPLANEMAADLAADLRDAEAEGASAEDLLGNGVFDPRTFAESWARERGLIRSRVRDRLDRRTAVILGAVVTGVVGAVVALVLLLGPSSSRSPSPPPTASAPTTTIATTVLVPDLIGLTQPQAIARARAVGVSVSVAYVHSNAGHGVVVVEQPSAGTRIRRGATLQLRVSR